MLSYYGITGFSAALVLSLVADGGGVKSAKYAVFVVVIRFFSSMTFQISYLLSAQTFPTLVTGLAFTCSNSVCRVLTLFAPFVAETMDNPCVLLVIISAISGTA